MRRYGYSMGQIYSTRLTDSLQNHNGSSDKSFYIIKLNLVLLFVPKTEFFPGTMKISQKVIKMGDIARNV